MESWNPYRWSLTFLEQFCIAWVDFCCWQKYRLKELGLIRQGETPHNIWYSMHCTLWECFTKFSTNILSILYQAAICDPVFRTFIDTFLTQVAFSPVLWYDSAAEKVLQIFTQVSIQTQWHWERSFPCLWSSRSLFMWLFKGAACVTSKLSQDFQNWMKIYTMLKIIFLDVQY